MISVCLPVCVRERQSESIGTKGVITETMAQKSGPGERDLLAEI